MQCRFEEPQNAIFLLLLFYIILDNQVSSLSSFIVHFFAAKKGKRFKKLLLLRVIFLLDKHQRWMTMGSLQGLSIVCEFLCAHQKKAPKKLNIFCWWWP